MIVNKSVGSEFKRVAPYGGITEYGYKVVYNSCVGWYSVTFEGHRLSRRVHQGDD
ncbi:hypothetical protein DPMN_098339 [Dreissena polymorpha]|uniref:Uncharacterized protein n=1 Tax=Dreissena polymorpha TaxID=45954 RepID=A0A9D4LBZ7_DREPO|nr:hypothetical protein DPMN_098339 [Dreissena polymorpha]